MRLLQIFTEDSWVIRLIANHIGYISFAIPIGILFLISKKSAHTRCKYYLYKKIRIVIVKKKILITICFVFLGPQPIRWFVSLLIRLFISDTIYIITRC